MNKLIRYIFWCGGMGGLYTYIYSISCSTLHIAPRSLIFYLYICTPIYFLYTRTQAEYYIYRMGEALGYVEGYGAWSRI